MASISTLVSTGDERTSRQTAASRRRSRLHEAPITTKPKRRRARIAWLACRVHIDAFRSAPLLYLRAVVWSLRGLRVRSRNRFAALAGHSAYAYRLWIERDEKRESPALVPHAHILIAIDCRQRTIGLERTLHSIRECSPSAEPILIGGDPRKGARHVASPRELASLANEDTWLLAMRPGDELAGHSLAIYSQAVAESGDAWLVYADDDLIETEGGRSAPHFKPDWNPELFEHHDMVSESSIMRLDPDFVAELPDEQWIDACVRSALDRGGPPIHLKHVLHHRRARPCPAIPAKPEQLLPDAAPSVTVIIPTRNGHALLRTAMEGVRRTAYPHVDTIIIDNGSNEPETLAYLAALESSGVEVLRLPAPFNYSALNNAAVKCARGDILCFLNNDVEIIDPDWLALLVRHATKADIGAVGARLHYPDGTIQHAGVFTGIGGGAGHAHRFQAAEDHGYFQRARLPQRVSAVTGACMAVSREKFLAVSGFDEESFPVAFNDVDLCLKLNSRGWQSFYEPRALLIHHESKSRGYDRSKTNRARFEGELAALKTMWSTDAFCDPYHHPNLSPFCEQFVVAL